MNKFKPGDRVRLIQEKYLYSLDTYKYMGFITGKEIMVVLGYRGDSKTILNLQSHCPEFSEHDYNLEFVQKRIIVVRKINNE